MMAGMVTIDDDDTVYIFAMPPAMSIERVLDLPPPESARGSVVAVKAIAACRAARQSG